MVNYKELTDSQFEAEVLVNLKHTLNVTQPEDLPVLKGKLKFLKEKGGNLSKKETDFLNKDVEKWRDILKRYITEPQDASIIVIGVFKYCAHTSDRKDYIYSGSTATYWRVIY